MVGGIQEPRSDQKLNQALRVLGRQRGVYLALVHRFDEQLRRGSPQIGLDFPQAHTLAGQRPQRRIFVVEVIRVGRVHVELHPNAQLRAVAQQSLIGVRNAPRARIEVLPLVELAHLVLALDLGVLGSPADGPGEAPHAIASLENPTLITQLSQLVPDYQSRQPGAEHEDPRARWPALQHRSRARLSPHQAPRVHGGHHQG